jgi:hypothetical protein
MLRRRRTLVLIAVGVLIAAGLAVGAVAIAGDDDAAAGACGKSVSTPVPQPSRAQLEAAGLDELPLSNARVDLVAPPFSKPTEITNPLFPISGLRSAVLNGTVEDKPFRTETTLLPTTAVLEWSEGQCVKTLVSQYLAYLGGRIEEVALDHYAQADDGSVWYLGENVFNYEDGAVADLEGTWLAGDEGPAAMIMPGHPQVGDTYRPENIAGLVFEEVTVKAVEQTVEGPRGSVDGAIKVRELHDDGTTEGKLFAPGYGEFFTASGGEVEAMALAVPTDALPGGVPDDLRTLVDSAESAYETAGEERWRQASRAATAVLSAWTRHEAATHVPPRLASPLNRATGALSAAVAARLRAAAQQWALEVEQAGLDLQLQYRPPDQIDLRRLDLWLRRLLVDARARDAGAVSGDVSTAEWIRDRVVRALAPAKLTRVDTLLGELRTNATDEDFAAAAATAEELRTVLSRR